jgi:8-oxo-dGTP pyrophosphatase MutT (NUDIX family)
VNLFQKLRRFVGSSPNQKTAGVHAIALTPAGKVVLVTLSHARGWRLPGGGRGRDEDPEAAVLRELIEEIGMVSYGMVQEVARFSHRPFRNHRSALFVVRDVGYRPRWSRDQGGAGI